MKTKKWYLLVVLLLLGAMVLAACGGDEETAEEPAGEVEVVEATEPPPTEPPPTEEPTAEPTEEPTEVPTEEPMEEPTEEPAEEPTEAPAEEPTEEPEPTAAPVLTQCEEGAERLVVWADETRTQLLVDIAPDFQAEYGVCLQVEQYGFGDIRDQVKIAAPAGEGPDVFVGAHDWLGELVINGLLAPIDLGDKRDQFLDVALQGCTYNSELYCMPYAIENVAFVYNPEILAAGGYDSPPTTWDEVREVAIDLEEQGLVENGYIIQQNDPYHFFPLMSAFGGYVFGRDADGNYDPTDVGIDSEGTIAAAEWLNQMAREGHIPPGVDYDVMHEMFESGDTAMIITGPWAAGPGGRLRESGIPYEVTTIPSEVQEATPFVGVQGFMISAFSEQQLLAEIFLTEFVATDEVMQQIFEAGGRPVAWRPVFENIEDPDIAGFAEAGQPGIPMPAIPEMSAVWTAWGDAQQLVITGEEEPQAAFENAAQQIRTAIEESASG